MIQNVFVYMKKYFSESDYLTKSWGTKKKVLVQLPYYHSHFWESGKKGFGLPLYVCEPRITMMDKNYTHKTKFNQSP